jgi:hypothetical protein
MIILKENIISFKLNKYGLFILISGKILLFEIVTFKYVCTFDDVCVDIDKNALTLTNNPIILAFPIASKKSHIKICKSN